jgi:Uma2 family endonuclease
MSMPATRHRFTLDDWHQMIEAGVLRKDQRLELLDGEIYDMAPIGPSHQGVVNFLTRFWVTRLGTRAVVSVQGPVTAPPRSEPQADLALLRDRQDFYRTAHSQPRDVFLVIEVAESSLDYDHAKLRFYARAGMSEVWIVNLPDDGIEVYRDPSGESYVERRVVRRGERLACLAFPDVTLAADDILG